MDGPTFLCRPSRASDPLTGSLPFINEFYPGQAAGDSLGGWGKKWLCMIVGGGQVVSEVTRPVSGSVRGAPTVTGNGHYCPLHHRGHYHHDHATLLPVPAVTPSQPWRVMTRRGSQK